MPKRPIQHEIADRAVAAVRKVWAETGAAVEEIRRDYGEDLLVQTSLNGRMDASRIWVQVKGTCDGAMLLESGRKRTVSVTSELARRWAQTADAVVVVLWDVDRHLGWFGQPPSGLDVAPPVNDGSSGLIGIEICSDDRFTREGAEVLAWRARLHHATRLVREFRGRQREFAEVGDDREAGWASTSALAVVIQTGVDLGILAEKDAKLFLTDEYRKVLATEFKRIREERSADQFGRAIALSVVYMAGKAGMDFILISELLHVVGVIFRSDERFSTLMP
jgi:hypothetical protein